MLPIILRKTYKAEEKKIKKYNKLMGKQQQSFPKEIMS